MTKIFSPLLKRRSGRRLFKRALEGFKDMMKKGVIGEIRGIKYKVLDTRVNGAGLDVEIELVENKDIGIAVLKLYGPNTKKKNVITVSKSNGSDAKFVIILAEEVIKPLIIKFLEEEETDFIEHTPAGKQSVSVRGKEVKLVKCPHCDKTSYSAPGLKCHITKMHKNIEMLPGKPTLQKKLNNMSAVNHHIYEEANKVVDHLIENVIEITSDEEESLEDVEIVT